MASGRPSSRPTSSATAGAFCSVRVNRGAAAAARWANSAIASTRARSSSDPRPGRAISRGPSGTTCSPRTRRGARLVTRTVSPVAAASSCVTTGAASSTCSKLSSSSRRRRRRRSSSRACRTGRSQPSSRIPSVAAIVGTTRAGSLTGARSTKNVPSANSPDNAAATSSARRVFPVPPGPVTVSSRVVASNAVTSATSDSRPTKEVSCAGRLDGVPPPAGAANPIGGRCSPCGAGIVLQDLRLEVAQLRAGVEAELVGEQLAVLAEDLEGLPRTAVDVESPHQQLDRPLPQRFAGHDLARGRDGVGRGAGLHEQRGTVLERRQPELLEPRGRRAGEAVGELPVGGSPPPSQRVVEQRARPYRIRRPDGASGAVVRLEALRVDRRRVGDEDVTRRAGDDRRAHRPEPGPQPGDDLLQRVGWRARWLLPPQRLHQPVNGDDRVRLQQECGEQRPRPWPGQRDRTVVGLDLQRTKYPEHHRRPPLGAREAPVSHRRRVSAMTSACQHDTARSFHDAATGGDRAGGPRCTT